MSIVSSPWLDVSADNSRKKVAAKRVIVGAKAICTAFAKSPKSTKEFEFQNNCMSVMWRAGEEELERIDLMLFT